jgi:hypothetical protein
MKTFKGTGELSDELAELENQVTASISAELRRVGRPVQMNELPHIPFNTEVQPYLEAIHLDEDENPVLDTSFSDVGEKTLSAFISDSEIGHWDLIAFLGMLQEVI